LEDIDDLLLKVIDGEITLKQAIAGSKTLAGKEMYFRIAELANASLSAVERQK
jgi:hypothetical protein